MSRLARLAALALAGSFAAFLAGSCSRNAPLSPLPNARPTVSITQAPSNATTPYWYAYEMRWSGTDADGAIAFYEYAIDPPTAAVAETAWTRTELNRQTVSFRATTVDSIGAPAAHDYHVFVLRAVDDRGARSAPEWRAFNAYSVTPTVKILQPQPNHLLTPSVATTFSFRLTGTDPDGRTTQRPVQYKWKLFSQGGADFDFATLLVRPDSLRRRYGPSFAEWDSVTGDTATVLLQDLTPDRDYVVVVLAIDETGAYSPIFNFDVNMLYVHVDVRSALGPRLRVFNESLDFTSGGGYSTRAIASTELGAETPVPFNWVATAATGGYITAYRWALDLGSITDETPRSDEELDITHWSAPSPFTTRVVLPAFRDVRPEQPEVHFLYIEATDNGGNKSLTVVQLTVVKPSFDRPLLVVDDTRLRADRQLASGCMQPPAEAWPTAAELDTFLYARGGVPWRCYPAGTLSSPGVLAGYEFDTLGTRGSAEPIVSLRTLGRYRHVIWYVDRQSATYTGSDVRTTLITALRYMSSPGRSNGLGTWSRQGGHLWLMGGGAAVALQLPWERVQPAGGVFSYADGELVPGRFMYDLAGWRSEITIGALVGATVAPPPENRAPGLANWTLLPPELQEKTPGTDELPPQRFDFDFYQSYCQGEWLSRSNYATEFDDAARQVVVLDTLYMATGSTGNGKPIMTYFHGPNTGSTFFTGLPVWYLRREHAIALFDFVLRDAWGLQRRNVPR